MNRKPAPRPDDPDQSKRFTDLAREVETEGDKKAFDRAVKKVASAPKKKPPLD